MITEAIIEAFMALLRGLLDLLPSLDLPAGIATLPAQAAALQPYLGTLSYWLPIGEALSAAALVLGLRYGMKAWQIYLRLYGAARGGTR